MHSLIHNLDTQMK